MIAEAPQQRVLDVLQGAACSWDHLKVAAKLNDERLGFMLGQLLSERLIWTAQRNDVRIHGIERRAGIVPRFSKSTASGNRLEKER